MNSRETECQAIDSSKFPGARRVVWHQAPVPQTTIIQQPAPQQPPPVIIQQPAPATQPAPVIVNPPAPAGGSSASVSDDLAIQAKIDKKIQDDPTYSGLGLTATVLDGKVTSVRFCMLSQPLIQLFFSSFAPKLFP